MKIRLAQCPPEFAASLETKTLDELDALQSQLQRERWALKARACAVADARAALIEHDNAAAHGLTVDQYRAVKGAVDVRPFSERIRRARKSKRKLQTAVATVAKLKAVATGAGASGD